MRRKEKEIKSKKELEKIISDAKVIRLALTDNIFPYILPLNFGYKDNVFYIHSAKEGKKIDIIKKNNNVAFEIDIENKLITNELACKFTMDYKSILGNGKAIIIDNEEEKVEGLNIIMNQYSNNKKFNFEKKIVDKIYIIKILINEISGKQSGYKEIL